MSAGNVAAPPRTAPCRWRRSPPCASRRTCHRAQGAHARLRALGAYIHQFVGEQPGATAAANRLLADRVGVMSGPARAQQSPRDFSGSPGVPPMRDARAILQELCIVTSRCSSTCRVLILPRFIRSRVSRRCAAAPDDPARGNRTAGERIQEIMCHAPGTAALAEDQALDAKPPRCLADSHRDRCMFVYQPMNMPKSPASEACELKVQLISVSCRTLA